MSNEIAVSSNKFVEAFKEKANEALLSYLGDKASVRKFISSMQMVFATNPKLAQCTQKSLSTVFMNCAEYKLYPSNVTGECYVVPYKDQATFQLGYQGMITLAYRAGVKRIDAQVVYAKDKFTYKLGLNPVLDHEPDIFSSDRGEPIGAFAIAILDNDESLFKIMSKTDIFKFRDKSQGKSSSSSPWKPENDPQLNMWKKTCVRQLFKLLPKSPVLQQALAADTKGELIDITPDRESGTVMSDSDIAAYRTRLIDSEGYTEEEIATARVQTINRNKFGQLTMDEAQLIESKLKQNRDERVIEGTTSTNKVEGE